MKGITEMLILLVMMSIIGVSVFLGFDKLFSGFQDSYAQNILAAAFGVIFTALVMFILLRYQTNFEEAKDRSVAVFKKKMSLNEQLIDHLIKISADNKMSDEERRELEAIVQKMSLVCKAYVVSYLRDFIIQSRVFPKFYWSHLTDQEKSSWKELGHEEDDFISLDGLVWAMRDDIGIAARGDELLSKEMHEEIFADQDSGT